MNAVNDAAHVVYGVALFNLQRSCYLVGLEASILSALVLLMMLMMRLCSRLKMVSLAVRIFHETSVRRVYAVHVNASAAGIKKGCLEPAR